MMRATALTKDFSKDLMRAIFASGQQGVASVEYIANYLTELGAASVLYETHYVDRHYLDDFTDYYARSFDPPATTGSRFHFFNLTCGALDGLLDQAYTSEHADARDQIEAQLEDAYLGFVVRRPLAGAPIGRTVLKTYPADGRRHYAVVRPYKVNVAGLRLTIEGLAYQQQDRGAAVCASTALWSALQRVAYVAGHRTPTPSSITRAANSPFPAAHGLHELQMATALATLGYVADQFSPAENRGLFRAKLVACLDSQLPVILLIARKIETGSGIRDVGHAVTVTGYSEPKSTVEVRGLRREFMPLRMKGGSVEVLYVHDDNLGSHAHYELRDSAEKDADGYEKLLLYRGRSNAADEPWWVPDKWTIRGALVPKPAKLRLPIENLFSTILWLRKLLEDVVFPGIELAFAPRFAAGTEYKRALLENAQLDLPQKRPFLSELALPRHVGVLSVFDGDHLRC